MSVQVGTLYRKKKIMKLNGQVLELTDETNGGAIIRNGHVVNQDRYQELLQEEEDRKKAAQALQNATKADPAVEAIRNGTATAEAIKVAQSVASAPQKMEELEKRIEAQDAKLDAILKALQK